MHCWPYSGYSHEGFKVHEDQRGLCNRLLTFASLPRQLSCALAEVKSQWVDQPQIKSGG